MVAKFSRMKELFRVQIILKTIDPTKSAFGRSLSQKDIKLLSSSSLSKLKITTTVSTTTLKFVMVIYQRLLSSESTVVTKYPTTSIPLPIRLVSSSFLTLQYKKLGSRRPLSRNLMNVQRTLMAVNISV